MLSDTCIHNSSAVDCSLDGAGLAESSLSEDPLNDSAAAEEDKKKTSLARPVSLLVVT